MIDDLVLADPVPRFVFWENRLFALPGALTDSFLPIAHHTCQDQSRSRRNWVC